MIFYCYLCHKEFFKELSMRIHLLFIHYKFVEDMDIHESKIKRLSFEAKRIREKMNSYKKRNRVGGNSYGNSSVSQFKIFIHYVERDCRFRKERIYVAK